MPSASDTLTAGDVEAATSSEHQPLVDPKAKRNLRSKFSDAMGKIKSGSSYAGSVLIHFGQKYNQGLYGLAVALITFGIERIMDDDVFNCPRKNSASYGLAFLIVPGLVLFFVNLMTVPESGRFYVWTICERCCVGAYHQRGDFLGGFISAIGVGFVAPTVWFLLAFLNGQHLVCQELGFQLGTNITVKYLEERGINKTIDEFEDRVHEVKAKSQFIGALLFGIIVFILFAMVVLKKSFIKPWSHDERLPGLHKFEKEEALAASKELKRLLLEENRPDLTSVADIVYSHKVLASLEQLQEINEKLKAEPSEAVAKELKSDKEQYTFFQKVIDTWNKYNELLEQQDFKNDSGDEFEKKVKNAKEDFEGEKKKLLAKQEERIVAASEALKSAEGELLKAEDKKKAMDVVKALSENVNKLKRQKDEFAIDKAVHRWTNNDEDQVEVRKLGQKLTEQAEEGSADTPRMRGKFVAGYIVGLYKQRKKNVIYSEDVLKKFRDIYPRAATSHPGQRYVNTGDPLYVDLFEDYGSEVGKNRKLPPRHVLIRNLLEPLPHSKADVADSTRNGHGSASGDE